MSFNVIKECFSNLCEGLKQIFNLSPQNGIFSDDLKVAKITPVFKSGEKTKKTNYRPISVLPCFLKMLERIICNRL